MYVNDFSDSIDSLKQKNVNAKDTINEDIIALVYEEFRKRLEKCVLLGHHVD